MIDCKYEIVHSSMQRFITGHICIFLTLIADPSHAKTDVLPFSRLGFDAACDKESTKDILKQETEVVSARSVYLLGRTARSNDDVFLDDKIRRHFAMGVVESDAIVMGNLDAELENSCLFYDILASEWDDAERRWRCLQRHEKRPNAALSLSKLDANTVDFYYLALCITKDNKSTKVAEYNPGYRLCSNRDSENHLKALRCSRKHKQLMGCFYKGNYDGWACQKLTRQDCIRTHRGDGGTIITKVCTADGNSFESLCEVLSTANRKLSAAVAVVKYDKPCPFSVAQEPYNPYELKPGKLPIFQDLGLGTCKLEDFEKYDHVT
uniref:Uncharacterized protein n=1 Tax=Romanomermis culicivorax TaxID=13658 RepID=A0A915KW30_ROMCU